MHPPSDSLSGLRKEILEFMRSCEAVLSIPTSESLTEDEVDIVRHYVQWLSEVREATKKSPQVCARTQGPRREE